MDLQRGLDPGIALHESPEQTGGKILRRRSHGQLEVPGIEAAHLGQHFLEAREGVKDVVTARVNLLARLRQVDAFAHLLEQREPDRLAQLPDLHRGRRLGYVQFLGGAGQASQPRAGLEYAQLRQRAVLEITADIRSRHGMAPRIHCHYRHAKCTAAFTSR
ncbi:hypothetical protein D3C83_11240 [compost metagenome]